MDWEHIMKKNPSLKRAFEAFSHSEKYQKWNSDYDNINWEAEVSKNRRIAAALGGPKIAESFAPTLGSNSSYSNCFNFTFVVGAGADALEKAKQAEETQKETEK
jgi:hypothetical protein